MVLLQQLSKITVRCKCTFRVCLCLSALVCGFVCVRLRLSVSVGSVCACKCLFGVRLCPSVSESVGVGVSAEEPFALTRQKHNVQSGRASRNVHVTSGGSRNRADRAR